MWYRACIFLLCSGCSVQPLYELKTETRIESRNGIYVDIIGGKNGQMLRGHLQDLVRDLDIVDERYTLSAVLQENRIPYALADDCNAQRLKINFVAEIKLKNSEGNSIFATSITGSTTRNIASTQGDVLLSMYDRANDSVLKNLAFRIVENLKVVLRK